MLANVETLFARLAAPVRQSAAELAAAFVSIEKVDTF
jgi:hypothetical protein